MRTRVEQNKKNVDHTGDRFVRFFGSAAKCLCVCVDVDVMLFNTSTRSKVVVYQQTHTTQSGRPMSQAASINRRSGSPVCRRRRVVRSAFVRRSFAICAFHVVRACKRSASTKNYIYADNDRISTEMTTTGVDVVDTYERKHTHTNTR